MWAEFLNSAHRPCFKKPVLWPELCILLLLFKLQLQCLTGIYDSSKKKKVPGFQVVTLFLELSYTPYLSGCPRFTPCLSLPAEKTPAFLTGFKIVIE